MADETNTPQKEKPDAKDVQVGKLELLQDLLLDDYLKQLRAGTLSPTDRANLVRWFLANGLDLDKTRIPKELSDKLTNKHRYDDDLTEDERKLKVI